MFEKFFTGIVAGVSAALFGWGKSPGEGFDGFKFGATIVIGVIAGIFSEVANIPIDNALGWFATTGMIYYIETGLKTLWRRIFSK